MFNLPKFGDGLCLARLADLLETLAVDRERLRRGSVVVTGSNGKGSAAVFCASIGRAYGLRTGLFTSPHLFRVNERFQIDGAPIGDDELARLEAVVAAAIAEIMPRRGETFGAFEAMFALACLYFQQSGCEFAVFEAGIGGRYDPVRLVGARVSCVTSVDYEHVELLGRTLDLIASDKSDACASGGTIIYGENCLKLLPHLVEYNRNRGVRSLFVGDHIEIAGEAASTAAQQFDLELADYQFFGLEMNLLGSFQFNNAAIAVGLFLLWLHGARPGSAAEGIDAAVRSGLREARWPGRLEMIKQNPVTVVDVGHTPDGIAQALRSLTAIYGAEDWILVLGISLDKPAAAIAGALAASFDTIVCTAAYHKGANAEAIADAVREANPQAVIHVATTVEQAVDLSQSLAASLRRRIFVAGGLFLAIEYSTVSRGGQARDLKFL